MCSPNQRDLVKILHHSGIDSSDSEFFVTVNYTLPKKIRKLARESCSKMKEKFPGIKPAECEFDEDSNIFCRKDKWFSTMVYRTPSLNDLQIKIHFADSDELPGNSTHTPPVKAFNPLAFSIVFTILLLMMCIMMLTKWRTLFYSLRNYVTSMKICLTLHKKNDEKNSSTFELMKGSNSWIHSPVFIFFCYHHKQPT